MVDVYGNLNLKQNQPTFAVVHKGTSFPVSPVPVAGQLFFKTDEQKLYFYNGTTSTWTAVGSGSSGGGLSKYVESFSSATNITITHALNDANPIVQVYGTDGEQITPDVVDILGANTVNLKFNVATNGWVIVHGGVPVTLGTTAYYQQSFSTSTCVPVAHALGQKYVQVSVYDTADGLIEPQSVTVVDTSNLLVCFGTATSGRVVVSGGSTGVSVYGVKKYSQAVSSGSSYTISHNLNTTTPQVSFINSGCCVVYPDVKVLDANSVCVCFGGVTNGCIEVQGGLQSTSPGAGCADFLPCVTNAYDLGSGTFKWKDGYFAGKLTVCGGVDPSYVELTPQAGATGICNNSLYIDSSDGYKLKVKNCAGVSSSLGVDNNVSLMEASLGNAINNVYNGFNVLVQSVTLCNVVADAFTDAGHPLGYNATICCACDMNCITTGPYWSNRYLCMNNYTAGTNCICGVGSISCCLLITNLCDTCTGSYICLEKGTYGDACIWSSTFTADSNIYLLCAYQRNNCGGAEFYIACDCYNLNTCLSSLNVGEGINLCFEYNSTFRKCSTNAVFTNWMTFCFANQEVLYNCCVCVPLATQCCSCVISGLLNIYVKKVAANCYQINNGLCYSNSTPYLNIFFKACSTGAQGCNYYCNKINLLCYESTKVATASLNTAPKNYGTARQGVYFTSLNLANSVNPNLVTMDVLDATGNVCACCVPYQCYTSLPSGMCCMKYKFYWNDCSVSCKTKVENFAVITIK